MTRVWYSHCRIPLGWRCVKDGHPAHERCALVPSWWNLWGAYWGRLR